MIQGNQSQSYFLITAIRISSQVQNMASNKFCMLLVLVGSLMILNESIRQVEASKKPESVYLARFIFDHIKKLIPTTECSPTTSASTGVAAAMTPPDSEENEIEPAITEEPDSTEEQNGDEEETTDEPEVTEEPSSSEDVTEAVEEDEEEEEED